MILQLLFDIGHVERRYRERESYRGDDNEFESYTLYYGPNVTPEPDGGANGACGPSERLKVGQIQ